LRRIQFATNLQANVGAPGQLTMNASRHAQSRPYVGILRIGPAADIAAAAAGERNDSSFRILHHSGATRPNQPLRSAVFKTERQLTPYESENIELFPIHR